MFISSSRLSVASAQAAYGGAIQQWLVRVSIDIVPRGVGVPNPGSSCSDSSASSSSSCVSSPSLSNCHSPVYRTSITTITTTTTLAFYSSSMTTTTDHNAVWDCSPPFRLSHRDLMASLVLSRIHPDTSFCYDHRTCPACAASSEAIALHQDCYEIVTQTCRLKDKQLLLQRLLTVASWRKPWREARPLLLHPSNVDKPRLNIIARRLGLQQLASLPVELADLIFHHSADALLWRGISAWRLADHLASMRDGARPPQVMWLREILSWERGGELVTSLSQARPPVVRLTLDADGIRCVESLSSHPPYLREIHKHTAYIVASIYDETLSPVRVEHAVRVSFFSRGGPLASLVVSHRLIILLLL